MAQTDNKGTDEPPVILVIDDEDYVADMIAGALELEGYIAHVAYNGRDGFDRAQSLLCNLIVIDIMMPYINGLDLTRQVRELPHLHNVPIVLVSAGARPRETQADVVFVPKPFDMDHLLLLIVEQLKKADAR